MEHVTWLKDFLVFLAAAGLAVPLLHRIGIGEVMGFLLLGVAIGPSGFGRLADRYDWLSYITISDPAQVAPFAELGVMFLLFLIGLELSLQRLAALRRYVLGIGGVQFVVSAIVIAGAIVALGVRPLPASVLGLCLAMSSTAVVMQLVENQGRTVTMTGRIALSVLLFQDLMVAPVLFATGILGHETGDFWSHFSIAMLQAAVVVGLIVGIGRYVLEPVLRFAAQTGSREIIMAITLLILIGLATLTARFGLSAALGAFLAGLLLSKTEYRHQIEIDLAPFKGLLLGLFFISVGMSLDIVAATSQLHLIFAAAVALLMAKAAILWGAARLLGVSNAIAAEVALLLPQAGEFGFVVVGIASASLLAPELVQFVTAVIVLTMLATPLCAFMAQRLGAALERRSNHLTMPKPDAEMWEDHVVIGGFGRVGQAIASILEAENVPFVALDHNASLVTKSSQAGCTVYFGDASRAELLERAGAARARAFIVTLNEPGAAQRMVEAILRAQPHAAVFARAADAEQARKLLALGVVSVIPETVEASLQLAGRLMEQLGFSDEAVARRITAMREEELGRLKPDKLE